MPCPPAIKANKPALVKPLPAGAEKGVACGARAAERRLAAQAVTLHQAAIDLAVRVGRIEGPGAGLHGLQRIALAPGVAAQQEADLAALVHGGLAALLALVLVAHVGAALRHHYVKGDTVLTRMLPWKTP